MHCSSCSWSCLWPTMPPPPDQIILDVDATDDPLHGQQEGRFFHGYYYHYCYLPLYIFCGDQLLVAALRPVGIDAAQGCLEHLQRLVSTLRRHWPQTHILIRGDSGFCRDAIMSWCEQSPGVDYVLGMAKNERLNRELEPAMEQAQQAYQQSERASRVFAEFAYRTHQSWSAERRVIGKAEYLDKGANPRYVVTSLSARDWAGAPLYEQLYCARGDMENRLKYLKACAQYGWCLSNMVAFLRLNLFVKFDLRKLLDALIESPPIRNGPDSGQITLFHWGD